MTDSKVLSWDEEDLEQQRAEEEIDELLIATLGYA